MSSVHEKINWLHKYLLDSMNSTDGAQMQQRREDIERYAKRLDMDCLCLNQQQSQDKQLLKEEARRAFIPIRRETTIPFYVQYGDMDQRWVCSNCNTSNRIESFRCSSCNRERKKSRQEWESILKPQMRVDVMDTNECSAVLLLSAMGMISRF
ncbi:hypothetical protein WA556_001521 [Blastocystis sp. ATCC 50177/Nand II]